MTAYAVFAVSAKYELFLGYTELATDVADKLLADILPKLHPDRAARWAEIQGSPPVAIERRTLENDDRWAHSLENNRFLSTSGKAFLTEL